MNHEKMHNTDENHTNSDEDESENAAIPFITESVDSGESSSSGNPSEPAENPSVQQDKETKPKQKWQRLRGDTIYGDVRSLAVKVLTRIERTDAYLERVIDFEIRHAEFLNDYDKSLLNEICHGVLRWIRRLDWFLNGFYRGNWEKAVPEIKNALRVALYQILFLNKIPDYAAVNEATEFVKRFSTQRHGDVVNGLLRTIIRTKEDLVYPTRDIDEVNYLGIMQSHPNWMVKRWIQRFGFEEAEQFAGANNKRPILTLRINTIKTTKDVIMKKLAEKNIQARQCRYANDFITIRLMSKIYLDEDFQNGFYSVQDESAGLVSKLLNPSENDIILDMCAAPGGKTTHLSQLMKNKGTIISADKYDIKIRNLKENAERLGCTNITFVQDDASDFSSEEIKSRKFDKILLDAPCSGLGVISKKPELRWKREPEDIPLLAELQTAMLENAFKYLKPGGVLVYSTCTTEPEENAMVVNSFLERHTECKIDNASQYVNSEIVNDAGCIETFPHKHGIDGSFAARIIRQT